jgi:DNA replication protein DnaC
MTFDIEEVFGTGPWACHCGELIDWPGACDRCAAKWQRQREGEEAQAALSTIPDRFVWAKFSAPEFAVRVNPLQSRAARLGFHDLLQPDRAKDSMVICGESGAGKTTIAVALMHQLVSKLPDIGIRARFASAIELGKSRVECQYGSRPQIVEMCNRASILFLDDLGAESASNKDPIVEVIQARHDANKVTVYTTWQTRPQIAQRYGGGVERRIYERGIVIDVAKYEPGYKPLGGEPLRNAKGEIA